MKTRRKWLTIQQVAEETGFNTSTIRRWVSGGELPGFYFGRHLRIRSENLTKFPKPVRPDLHSTPPGKNAA